MHNSMHIAKLAVLVHQFFDLFQSMVDLPMFCVFIGQMVSSQTVLKRHVPA